MTSLLEAATLIGGVYIFFLGFGVAQEKVFKVGDHRSGDLFRYAFFLVFCFCCANVVLSFVMLLIRGKVVERLRSYSREVYTQLALCAITYLTSMLATNYALKHVSYPTQVIIKSIKMVPVTIGGFVFFGKRYPWYDYIAVGLISSALTLFNMAKPASSSGPVHQSGLGIVLLFVALFCDSLTGPRQDKLLAKVPQITPVETMFITNVFAVVYAGAITFGVEGTSAIQFCIRHPIAIRHIATFAACGACGQIFVFNCLSSFGSLYLTLITTTRKFFTILLSVLVFGHRINPAQWGCVAAIFASITFQSVLNKQRKSKAASAPSAHKVDVADRPTSDASVARDQENLRKSKVN